MTEPTKPDLGRLAQSAFPAAAPEAQVADLSPASLTRKAIMRTPEVAWMEATRGLQGSLIRSLRDYKTTWRDKSAIASHRQRMIDQVTSQYVDYLREEAKLASDAALKARDAILRQELTKLRAQLFTQLADITGKAVLDIETIFQDYAARISSPMLQEAYARFIMNKVLDLLEQSPQGK